MQQMPDRDAYLDGLLGRVLTAFLNGRSLVGLIPQSRFIE